VDQRAASGAELQVLEGRNRQEVVFGVHDRSHDGKSVFVHINQGQDASHVSKKWVIV
jgi:hypothetical protein